MSQVDTVDLASEWTRVLVAAESRGHGDRGNAIRRVARRIGTSVSRVHALVYRPPKDLSASLYLRLASAYIALSEEQMRRLQHDIELTRQIAGPDCRAVRAAEALVGAAHGAAAPEDETAG